MNDAGLVILGAGVAGLAAGQRLQQNGTPFVIYERGDSIGGHCRSDDVNGFVFDEGPHVSFTKRPEIQRLLAAGLADALTEQDASVSNYWNGHVIPHPVQCNLRGLPSELIAKCVADLAVAQLAERRVENYADWCYRHLGRRFAEEFSFRYTRKYWATEPSAMGIDWIGARIYVPTLEDVIQGAIGTNASSHHYLTKFRYPNRGGFQAFMSAFNEVSSIKLGHELVGLDLQCRRADFANGAAVHFGPLISSIPLPDLIASITDAPVAVREAASRLRCSSLVLVNVGIKGEVSSPSHWAYVYDDDAIFARVSWPHRLSPNNTPPGSSSIQFETYFTSDRPLACDDVLSRTISDAMRLGIIGKNDAIAVAVDKRVRFANVVYDLERAKNLATIQEFLSAHDVFCCGRYGEWAYYWSDDSILSGWRVADKIQELLFGTPARATVAANPPKSE